MLQGGEMIIIALLALVVLGPKRLPELARKVGQWSAELRQAARDITQGLEAEVEDLKKVGEDLKAPVDEIIKPLKEISDEMKAADPRALEWTGPKSLSGPTPDDAMADLEAIEEAQRVSRENDDGVLDEEAE
jgi:sec-independent protein translocase protein TatB